MQDNRHKFSENEKQVLFDEVHGRCPICGKRLTHSKNGHIYRTFEVAHIYPANPKPEEEKLLAVEERLSDDVNGLKNVVAVCRICHKKFDTPTFEHLCDLYNYVDASIHMQFSFLNRRIVRCSTPRVLKLRRRENDFDDI